MNKREQFYLETLAHSGYNATRVERKFQKLDTCATDHQLFQLKAAILFLSGSEDEIDSLIDGANRDRASILNAATVKEERGGT